MELATLFQVICIAACLNLQVESGLYRHSLDVLQSPLIVRSSEDPTMPENEEETTSQTGSSSITVEQDILSALGDRNGETSNEESSFERIGREHLNRCQGSFSTNSSHDQMMRLMAKSFPVHEALQSQDALDEIQTRTVKYMAQTRPTPIHRSRFQNSFYFEVERDMNSVATSVEFYIYVRPVKTENTKTVISLLLSSINGSPDSQDTFTPMKHVVDLSKKRNAGSWERILLTNLTGTLLENPRLRIRVDTFSNEFPDLIATGESDEGDEFKPYLMLSLVFLPATRPDNLCKPHDYVIDFADIGWDWIIYPTSFNPKYCGGSCVSSSIHNLLLQSSGQTADRGPCCVPKRYAPLSILYYDSEGNIVYSEMPNMEIVECECI